MLSLAFALLASFGTCGTVDQIDHGYALLVVGDTTITVPATPEMREGATWGSCFTPVSRPSEVNPTSTIKL